jgi:hypothetical protein
MGAEQEKTQAFQIGQRLTSILPRALPCPFSYCHFHHCLLDKYIAVMDSWSIKAIPAWNQTRGARWGADLQTLTLKLKTLMKP